MNMDDVLKEVLRMVQHEIVGRNIVWSIGRLPEVYGAPFQVMVPGQTVEQGDISFTPRIQRVFELRRSWSLRHWPRP